MSYKGLDDDTEIVAHQFVTIIEAVCNMLDLDPITAEAALTAAHEELTKQWRLPQ